MNIRFIILSILVLPFFACNQFVDQNNVDAQNDTSTKMQLTKLPELELISNNGVKQFNFESSTRFDLSGICIYNDSIYVIADKAWNKFIYKIDTLKNTVKIIDELEICLYEKIDIEGIDADSLGFYIINERSSEVYYKNKNSCLIKTLEIDWSKLKIKTKEWSNKGLEGLAIDQENNILYLIKERSPRRIIAFDLNTGYLSEPFDALFDKEINDFTDAKFENGKLYLLERNNSSILRIDVTTKETYSVSVKNILNPNHKRLYKTDNPEYGTAESLLLTKNEIWIGIDNNGEKTSAYGQELGLDKSNNPVILIFKRPNNF